MNTLSAVLFLVTVATSTASGILGHGIIGGPGIIAAHGAGTVTGLGAPAVLTGPAGTVVRGGVAAAPAIIAGHGIAGIGAGLGAGILGGGAIIGAGGLLGHGLVGSGLEGQWIPDINEKLYDDGSYKPHIYGH